MVVVDGPSCHALNLEFSAGRVRLKVLHTAAEVDDTVSIASAFPDEAQLTLPTGI